MNFAKVHHSVLPNLANFSFAQQLDLVQSCNTSSFHHCPPLGPFQSCEPHQSSPFTSSPVWTSRLRSPNHIDPILRLRSNHRSAWQQSQATPNSCQGSASSLLLYDAVDVVAGSAVRPVFGYASRLLAAIQHKGHRRVWLCKLDKS